MSNKDSRFVHYCSCGQWGAFGYGVSLLKGKLGTWYCRAHRPDTAKKPPQIIPEIIPEPQSGQLPLL